MLISIQSTDHKEPPEWALVELQGKIEYSEEELTRKVKDIGMLHAKDDSIYQLTIGYHQLEGKRVSLKKPLLILDKGQDGCSYRVKGVIRSKVLFKTRPLALISKPVAAQSSELPTKGRHLQLEASA